MRGLNGLGGGEGSGGEEGGGEGDKQKEVHRGQMGLHAGMLHKYGDI